MKKESTKLFKDILKISQKIKKNIPIFSIAQEYLYSEKYEFGRFTGIIDLSKYKPIQEFFKTEKIQKGYGIKIKAKEFFEFSKNVKKGVEVFYEIDDECLVFDSPSFTGSLKCKIHKVDVNTIDKFITKQRSIKFLEFNEEAKKMISEIKDSTFNLNELLENNIDSKMTLRCNGKILPTILKKTELSISSEKNILKYIDSNLELYFIYSTIN